MVEPHLNGERAWTVGALCRAFADALDAHFNPVVVKGEVSGFSRAASGHCYFVLKDSNGQLRCAMFRRAATQLGFNPRDGDRVEVHAKVSVYEPRGELQLIVEAMQHEGQGSLYEQFIRLKERLAVLGLFNQERKRAVLPVPAGIGLVTSLGAAALHDVVTALRRRVPHIPVVLAPSLVQGEQAAAHLITAMQSLYAIASDPEAKVRIDTILLVRGGGSLEDLWPFNDESLAHVIAASPVPVISGIGHETDFTIADFVADLRAPTPTAAAEMVAIANQDLADALTYQEAHLHRSVQHMIEREAQRLDGVSSRLGRPSHFAHQRSLELSAVQQRMVASIQSRLAEAELRIRVNAGALNQAKRLVLANCQSHLRDMETRLEGQNPRQVLSRGYAWLATQEGIPLSSIERVVVGQSLKATLADGTVELLAQSTRPN